MHLNGLTVQMLIFRYMITIPIASKKVIVILKMKVTIKRFQMEQTLVKKRREKVKKVRNKKEIRNINQNNSMFFYINDSNHLGINFFFSSPFAYHNLVLNR